MTWASAQASQRSYLLELRSAKEELVQVVWYILILKITFSSVENTNPFSLSACSARISAAHRLEPVFGCLYTIFPSEIIF